MAKVDLEKIRTRLEGSLQDIIVKAKEAEASLAVIQKKIAQIDKESAKSEILKARTKVQGEIGRITRDLGLDPEHMRTEVQKARGRVQETLKGLKTQIKSIAEAERAKRSGRRRSE